MPKYSFMRKTELIVKDRKFHSDDFAVFFDVPFSDEEEAEVVEIEIYNLSESTLNNMSKGDAVILNAGYEGDVGAILLGVLQKKNTEWDGTDKLTTLKCTDASEAWTKQTISKSYKKGIRGSYILQDLANELGVEIGAISLPNDKVYARGRSVSGSITYVMQKVAIDCGATVRVTRGKVFIRDPRYGDETSFLLSPEHGLVGTPERFEEESEDGETVKGWNVTCLLNHRLAEGLHVRVASSTANGRYRIRKGTHKATDSDFVTEMEVV
ncbi:phage protein [Salibacterium halotolerans]|uniref:Uncharacterized protein n=1 Tax=Salibacterium halotolerans TaxID=1884432 RepID=A0A1I5NBG6_9BACI|nr:hypothetical protein [Salibacterium halotolerans]SFP19040.1 hypothetical protein SAMN05518683_10367 [Salibacterium halotolerans]